MRDFPGSDACRDGSRELTRWRDDFLRLFYIFTILRLGLIEIAGTMDVYPSE